VYLIVHESFCRYKVFEVAVVYDYSNLVGSTLEFSALVFKVSDNRYRFFVIDLVVTLGWGVLL
jgi:hypothetical protein